MNMNLPAVLTPPPIYKIVNTPSGDRTALPLGCCCFCCSLFCAADAEIL